MHFFHNFLKKLDKYSENVYAHCDIPCGIYDPHLAQVAAYTVVRMVNLIEENKDNMHMKVRCTLVKEEHIELCKKEVRIIWGDYFKPEHLKEYPELHDVVWKIMKLCSKARQTVDAKIAEELLEAVNKFAEIFWSTKGKETVKSQAPYPTGKEIVYPKF